MENTISGSMARRLKRPTKSDVVKKFTIMSDMLAYSPISPAGMADQGVSTGGKIFMIKYMRTAAMAPVTRKVMMVVLIIFPARLRLCMVATLPPMDENTMGTTMQNIRLMKTVPSGFKTVAPALMVLPSASVTTGKNQPTTAPRIMEPSMMARNA